MVGEKKKKNKDPHRMRSILSALLRMKFTIRRWVTGRRTPLTLEIRERKLKQKILKERKSNLHSLVADHPVSSSTEAATRLPMKAGAGVQSTNIMSDLSSVEQLRQDERNLNFMS